MVAVGSKAGRRAGSPGSPLPPSTFCTSVPVIHSSSNAHDLFLGFTSVKAELRLLSLREPFPIKAAHLRPLLLPSAFPCSWNAVNLYMLSVSIRLFHVCGDGDGDEDRRLPFTGPPTCWHCANGSRRLILLPASTSFVYVVGPSAGIYLCMYLYSNTTFLSLPLWP